MLKKNKGITLIALIITIVVLLILAVVAISAVNNTGIIERARAAKTKQEEGKADEDSKLQGYEAVIEANIPGENSTSGDKIPATYATTMEGLADGVNLIEYANLTEELKKAATDGTITAVLTETKNSETYTAVIPKGFTVSTKDGEDSISAGLVVTDGTSEFVWVPVTDMNSFARLKVGIKGDYNSVLYDFSGTTLTESTQTNNYSEPGNSSWDSTTEMSIWTETLYQDSFNNMVTSVETYGGFYVGRYETSMNGAVAQSKVGEMPIKGISWYETYEKSLTYSKNNTSLEVTSEMIWACQWNAMLKFILAGDDASHITTTPNVSHDLTDAYSTGGTDYKGSITYNDKLNNIYDIEGNVAEWTQEKYIAGTRMIYGGRCDSSTISFTRSTTYPPNRYGTNVGSRITLYIGRSPVATKETYATKMEGLADGVNLVEYENLTEELKTAADNGKITAVLTETKNSETYTAVIPKGFTVSTIDGEDSISGGLVITDGISEFVWIPVSDMNSFARLQEGSDINYEGVLYDFSGTTATEKTYYGVSTSSHGEPVNVGFDTTTSMSIWTESLYQTSFNKMAKSVETYGGFYVGRYETSLNGSVAQSKSGETPMYGINWYRMYENSLTYSKNNTRLKVTSEMIWGCQWDAMLKFILTGNEASHVTSGTNVGHKLLDYTSQTYKTGGTNYLTVYKESEAYNDKASNIYDLEGNVWEWTQEKDTGGGRTSRGGNCFRDGSPSMRGTGDNGMSPRASYGSRFTLYINL